MSTFNEANFERKLLQLRETHESISNLSSWCLANQSHHYKIVSTWLTVLKKVKIEHRLILFYLANDVIQYSRKKHLPFVESFAPALQKATTLVREDSVKNKILRLFKIWDERGVYDESFLLDLSGLLICDPKGGSRMDVQDFQPNVLYSRMRSCKKLEDDTDLKLKVLNESTIPCTDLDELRKSLKDREHGEDIMEDVTVVLDKVKAYVDALEAEIKERSGLIDLLETGEQYYDKDLREAKIVSNAYKCFGQRVKLVQKKLDEKISTLPSPIPSPPDANAPSPPPLSPAADNTVDNANISDSDFTMGESFINNKKMMNTVIDFSQHEASYFGDKPQNDPYYIPPVYNPSMTTGHPNKVAPATTPVPPVNSSAMSNSFSGNSDSFANNSDSDIFNYNEDYFTGTPSCNPPAPYSAVSNNSSMTYSSVSCTAPPFTPPYNNCVTPNSPMPYTPTALQFSPSTGNDFPLPLLGSQADIPYPLDQKKANPPFPLVNNPPNSDKLDADSKVFSSLMEQIAKNRFIVPPPPPPPPPPPLPVVPPVNPANNSNDAVPSTEGNKIEVISTTPSKISVSEILETLLPKSESAPLKPPPLPPSMLQIDEPDKKFTWSEGENWESPESPSIFDESFPLSDSMVDKLSVPSSDVDMRKKDVDHRNLISLTGTKWLDKENPYIKELQESMSPSDDSLNDFKAGDSKLSSQHSKREKYEPIALSDEKPPPYKPAPIKDYRPEPLPDIKHPPIPNYTPSPIANEPVTKSQQSMDNIENVDMEMSDDEDFKDDEPEQELKGNVSGSSLSSPPLPPPIVKSPAKIENDSPNKPVKVSPDPGDKDMRFMSNMPNQGVHFPKGSADVDGRFSGAPPSPRFNLMMPPPLPPPTGPVREHSPGGSNAPWVSTPPFAPPGFGRPPFSPRGRRPQGGFPGRPFRHPMRPFVHRPRFQHW